jgi:hypothetical protein
MRASSRAASARLLGRPAVVTDDDVRAFAIVIAIATIVVSAPVEN